MEKFRMNAERDRRKEQALHDLGWQVITIWECETSTPEALTDRLRRELAA
jgi:DNA mismatch endonuclease (patch repair protein)